VAHLVATIFVEMYDDLMPAILAAQSSDCLVRDVSAFLVDGRAAYSTDTAGTESHWEVVTAALTHEGTI